MQIWVWVWWVYYGSELSNIGVFQRIGDLSFSNSRWVFVSQGYGVSRERGEREESGSWGSVMAESKREKQRSLEERERKWEEKKKVVNNGNKLGPTKELSLDLKLAWIQKQVKG